MKRPGQLKRTPLPEGVIPLARGTELKRSKGIGQSNALHPSRGLAARSPVRAKLYRLVRAPAVRDAVEANRPCEVGEVLGVAGVNRTKAGNIFAPCHEWPSRGHDGWGFHHRRKASAGGSDRNRANLIWSCEPCNELVEVEPRMVREATGWALIVREGDPEWAALGRRADP